MARAVAECKCATCGEEFTFKKLGFYNRAAANSFEEWAAENVTECPSCRRDRIRAEMEEERRKTAEAAKEAGLPELEGTERQVAWALVIRQKKLDTIDKEIRMQMQGIRKKDKAIKNAERNIRFRNWLAETKTSASWWIDHRDGITGIGLYGFGDYQNSCPKLFGEFLAADVPPEEKEMKKAAEEEMTVAPENRTYDGVVKIIIKENVVSAATPKSEDFRKLVKSLGYRWDYEGRNWYRFTDAFTGSPQDRAAELGNKCLNAGFAIQIADPEVREKAINGSYEPEHRRWVAWAEKSKKLAVLWEKGNDALYQKIRGIRGAKYKKGGCFHVPVENYEELEEFAELHDFKWSEAAKEAVEEYKKRLLIVSPGEGREAEYADGEAELLEVLNSSRDVLDDLKEDD